MNETETLERKIFLKRQYLQILDDQEDNICTERNKVLGEIEELVEKLEGRE